MSDELALNGPADSAIHGVVAGRLEGLECAGEGSPAAIAGRLLERVSAKERSKALQFDPVTETAASAGRMGAREVAAALMFAVLRYPDLPRDAQIVFANAITGHRRAMEADGPKRIRGMRI